MFTRHRFINVLVRVPFSNLPFSKSAGKSVTFSSERDTYLSHCSPFSKCASQCERTLSPQGGLSNFRRSRAGANDKNVIMVAFQFFYPIFCGVNIQFQLSNTHIRHMIARLKRVLVRLFQGPAYSHEGSL